jgi:pimeloyl-ACP methyl ester carboxylesterase
MDLVAGRGLPAPWLLGWSFGTEVALAWGLGHPIAGAILLSPPLKRTSSEQLAAWAGSGKRLIAVVPEFDDYLRPDEARERFAIVPETELVAIAGGKHLWVGEAQTRRVLTEIVRVVNPSALPLPTEWQD